MISGKINDNHDVELKMSVPYDSIIPGYLYLTADMQVIAKRALDVIVKKFKLSDTPEEYMIYGAFVTAMIQELFNDDTEKCRNFVDRYIIPYLE